MHSCSCGSTQGSPAHRTSNFLASILPRSKRFRARWFAKKLLQLSGSLGLMLFVTEQYIQPTIDNSLRPMREMVSGGGLCGCMVWRGIVVGLVQAGSPAHDCGVLCIVLPHAAVFSRPPRQDWLRMLERILKLSIPTLYW